MASFIADDVARSLGTVEITADHNFGDRQCCSLLDQRAY
jgi:hypothetical protein